MTITAEIDRSLTSLYTDVNQYPEPGTYNVPDGTIVTANPYAINTGTEQGHFRLTVENAVTGEVLKGRQDINNPGQNWSLTHNISVTDRVELRFRVYHYADGWVLDDEYGCD